MKLFNKLSRKLFNKLFNFRPGSCSWFGLVWFRKRIVYLKKIKTAIINVQMLQKPFYLPKMEKKQNKYKKKKVLSDCTK